tara:strand:- start:22 stop:582 length:561 start_codon:yes stop_codon:yes gene_type:complete
MKKNILLVTTLLVGIISVYFIDLYDRIESDGSRFSSMSFVDNEYRLGDENNDNQYPKELYSRNFGNPKYEFPRSTVKKIKISNNIPLLGRLTSKTITEKSKIEFILEIFNNPKNFDWGETTWSINESEYIFRFYDEQNLEIGKVWLCMKGCGITHSLPFSPNMKFGGLSKLGKVKINELLNKIIEL